MCLGDSKHLTKFYKKVVAEHGGGNKGFAISAWTCPHGWALDWPEPIQHTYASAHMHIYIYIYIDI